MKKLATSLMVSLFISSCAGETPLITQIESNSNTSDVNTFAKTKNGELNTLIQAYTDKRFNFADKNKDKKLIFSEFKGLESEHEDVMQKIFNEYDKNKDKSVSYEEFVNVSNKGTQESLKQLFALSDMNKNNSLEKSEVEMISEIAQEYAADSGLKKDIKTISNEYMSFDKNKNGKLEYDEYLVPQMRYILLSEVDPYKNGLFSSVKSKITSSIERFIDGIMDRLILIK